MLMCRTDDAESRISSFQTKLQDGTATNVFATPRRHCCKATTWLLILVL